MASTKRFTCAANGCHSTLFSIGKSAASRARDAKTTRTKPLNVSPQNGIRCDCIILKILGFAAANLTVWEAVRKKPVQSNEARVCIAGPAPCGVSMSRGNIGSDTRFLKQVGFLRGQ